jgi:HEAT repeat protein
MGSDLVANMVWVSFVVSFLKFLQDYQYSAALAQHYQDQASLAAFLGYYESAITVLILAVQTSLTSPLLRRLKLGVVVAMLPGTMAVTCALGAMAPTLAVIVGAKVVYTILSNGFYNPAGSLLVGPLEPGARDRARLAVSTSTSAGCLSLGVLLQLGMKKLAAGTCFSVMAIMFAVAYLLSRRLDRAYLAELGRELSATDVGRRMSNVRALRVVSQTYAAERIIELIADPDPYVRERAVREVKFLGRWPARRVLERVLAGKADARVRATALAEVVGVLGDEALDLAMREVSDPDRRIQANALEAVAAVGNETAVATLRDHLESTDHRLRAIAAVGLVRATHDTASLERALGVVAGMARAPDPLWRATAAVSMGELGYPFFAGALLVLVADPVDQVSDRAIEALERMRAQDAAPALLRLSSRPELAHRAGRLEAACTTLEDEGARDLLAVMESLSGEERARLTEHLRDVRHSVRAQVLRHALSLASARARQAVVAYLHRATHSGAPALVAACLASDPPSIAPALDAMRSGDYRGEEAISRLLVGFLDAGNAELLRAYLREVWGRVRATVVLARRHDPGSREAAELARRRSRLLAHGFALVGLHSRKPRQVVESLVKALEGDRFVASLSMELVAARIGHRAAADLIPLLEELGRPEPATRLPAAGAAAADPAASETDAAAPDLAVPADVAAEADRLATALSAEEARAAAGEPEGSAGAFGAGPGEDLSADDAPAEDLAPAAEAAWDEPDGLEEPAGGPEGRRGI